MARVPLLDAEDLPEEYRYLFTENDVGDADIFRAMANAPEQMQAYMRYGTTLWGILPEREREVAILAAARALEHEYEWHQHVRLGREAGVTDAEINAISAGDLAALEADDAAIVAYVRGVVHGDTPEADHDRVVEAFDVETATGLALLASHYIATAAVLDAFGVTPEEEFIGWTV